MDRDLRKHLDIAQTAWLETLDKIIGAPAAVEVGYEGEPLHFTWVGPMHFFEISFDDDEHLSFHWISTLPLRQWIGEDGTQETEYFHVDYEDSYGLAFGRVPRVLVQEMKRFGAYLASSRAETEGANA